MHQKIINIDKDDCVAVFSDIHGNKEALLAILDDIKKKKIKNIICLGDTIAIGPNPKECLDLIIKEKIPMVLGNHELYYLLGTQIDDEFDEAKERHYEWIRKLLKEDYRDYLSKCPMEIVINCLNKKVCFQHYLFNPKKNDPYPFAELDAFENNNHELDMVDSDYLFIGHDHYASEHTFHNKKIYVVGSSGCTKDNQTFYTLLKINDDILKFEKIYLPYNRIKFEKFLRDIDYPDKEEIQKIFFGI